MRCYDCMDRGVDAAAVAVCMSCGAGVCADCVRAESRGVDQHATLGRPSHAETRTLLCPSCDRVLAHRPLATV